MRFGIVGAALLLLLTASACGTDKNITAPCPCGDGDNDADDVNCPHFVLPIKPQRPPMIQPHRFSAEGCTVTSTEKGIYSAIHGDEVYLVINMSNTNWFSDTSRLVLFVNPTGPVEVDGVATTLSFGPADVKVNPTSLRVEFELAAVNAIAHEDGSPSFWVRAETSDGCFLGSFFVPFGHGNK